MADSSKDIQLRELKDMITELKNLIKTLQATVDAGNKREEALTQERDNLKEEVELLRKKLFGTSSEKRSADLPGQLNLFNEAEMEQDPAAAEAEEMAALLPEKKRKARATNAESVAAGKMEILEGSVEKLPFEAETFDKIVTVESFYFWPNPQENLKEVRRVLKTGGTFLLVADIYEKPGLPREVKDNIRKFHLFNPTREQFKNLFREAGFAETRIHTKDGEDWICVEGTK